MARLPRLVVPGLAHLVVQRARGAPPVFADEADRRDYLAALAAALPESRVTLHAYALLPDEVRLLATPTNRDGLARLMQAIGRRQVRAWNTRHGRSGTPWEGRFRSTVVDADAAFVTCLRFAEGVDDEALVSSLPHHLGQAGDPLVTDHPAFWRLGNTPFDREAAYRQSIEQPLPTAEKERVLTASLRGWALGADDFVRRVEAQAGRRAAPARRGRPRKAAAKLPAPK